AVGRVLGQLDLSSPAARPVLQTIVRLPRNVRSEAARGLSAGQSLPGYGVQAMNTAASRIGDAVASRWTALPLTIRYAAAESTVGQSGSAIRTVGSPRMTVLRRSIHAS